MKLIYHKMGLFPIPPCWVLPWGMRGTNVSSADPAGPPLGLVISENEPRLKEALEEKAFFTSVIVHIA